MLHKIRAGVAFVLYPIAVTISVTYVIASCIAVVAAVGRLNV